MPQFWLRPLMVNRKQDWREAIVADLRRGSHSSLLLLMLKGLNTALTALLNFILAYALIRVVGLQAYATVASLLAIAALVVQSDLGITGLAFFKLRSHYLRDVHNREASPDDQGLVVTIVMIYVAIAGLAVMILGLAFTAGIVPVAPHGLAYLLIFAGAVCALPRMPLRVAINARDGFVWTEGVELGRRVALLTATLAMFLGFSLISYGVLTLLIWLMSIAALIWLARPYGFTLRTAGVFRGILLLRHEFRGVRSTVVLSSADFLVSIFPYYLLSAFGDVTAIVAFDMFYKVTRFAALSYLIGAETVLPHQTRAVHDRNASGLKRATAAGFILGILPMSLGIFVVLVFGEEIFGLILNHEGIVTPIMRVAICAMLVFMLIQTTCAIVLIAAGRFEALARRSMITVAGMALISALTILFHWSIDEFIVAYVAVYGGGALLSAECLWSLTKSVSEKKA